MARLPREKIQEIRQSVDIVDVIGNYISLERSGRNYKGLCPFHEDSNPSMSVSPEKQIYHCFVCNAGGNVFDFVVEYNKISFIEAVKIVADLGNVDLSGYQLEYQAPVDEHKQPLYQLQDDALNLYSFYLFTTQGKLAKEYLAKRHLDNDVINYFNIGYAPHGNVLTKAFKQNGIDYKTMVKTGLVVESYEGKDLFEHRIIFPIHNNSGQVVAFSGRLFDDNPNAPKYINSPETEIFIKGNTLYNYHRAVKSIRQSGYVIICEGFMDVIAYYRAGIENAVALMGTAFTKNHLNAIKRVTKNVYISLDGDNAGKQATVKILDAMKNQGFNIKVVSLPKGQDPDEILEINGKEALVSCVDNAMVEPEFLFDYYYRHTNMNNYEDKKDFITKMVAVISEIENQFDHDYYVEKLADITGVSLNIIQNQLKNNQPIVPVEYEPRVKQYRPLSVIDKYSQAQQGLLYYMLQDKKLAKLYELKLGFMVDKSYQLIANYILDYYRSNEKLNVADFLGFVDQKQFQKTIIDIAQLDLPNINDEDAMEDYMVLVKEKIQLEKIDYLIKLMNESIDNGEKQELAIEILNLKKEVKNGCKK